MVVIATIMLATMIPLSLYAVRYPKWALEKEKLSNRVNYDHVYGNGYYWLGLNKALIEFPATFQFIRFGTDEGETPLSVFSNEGLEFFLDCNVGVRMRKEAVPSIHKAFRLGYMDQVKNLVVAAIKNTATLFSTDDFITRRNVTDLAIASAVQAAVGTIGFDMPLENFQLRRPQMPESVVLKYRQALVQLINNGAQTFVQQKAMVEQQTNVLEQQILANASRVAIQSNATASRLITEARAYAQNRLLIAEQQGLAELFAGMNVTDPTIKRVLQTLISVELNPTIRVFYDLAPALTLGV